MAGGGKQDNKNIAGVSPKTLLRCVTCKESSVASWLRLKSMLMPDWGIQKQVWNVSVIFFQYVGKHVKDGMIIWQKLR